MQKEKNARQGFWEHSEYEKFRDAPPVDERAMFIFGYWTGCRFGEISQLEWSQVDFDGRAVRLRDDQTKAKEPRIIPLGGPGNDLHAMLLEQQTRRAALCPDTPWVFFRQGSIDPNKESARRGRQVQDIRKAWDKAVKDTGINRLFHDLRRTGVRNLVRLACRKRWPCSSADTRRGAFSSVTTLLTNAICTMRRRSCIGI